MFKQPTLIRPPPSQDYCYGGLPPSRQTSRQVGHPGHPQHHHQRHNVTAQGKVPAGQQSQPNPLLAAAAASARQTPFAHCMHALTRASRMHYSHPRGLLEKGSLMLLSPCGMDHHYVNARVWGADWLPGPHTAAQHIHVLVGLQPPRSAQN